MEQSVWVKGCDSGACVEVMALKTIVKVRDSKDKQGSWLTFTHEEWAQFVQATKAGVFDV